MNPREAALIVGLVWVTAAAIWWVCHRAWAARQQRHNTRYLAHLRRTGHVR